MRPKNLSTLEHSSIVGIGDSQGKKAAKLTIAATGIGTVTPLSSTTGSDAAQAAALDISELTKDGSRLVRVVTAGDANFRFGVAGGPAVTIALFHAAMPSGSSETFLLSQEIKQISGWGIGGAWNYTIYPLDEV